MNLHKIRVILTLGLLFVLAIFFVCTMYFSQEICLAIFFALFAVWYIFWIKYYKCPHCNKFLGKPRYGATHCQYCGEKLDEDYNEKYEGTE